MLVFLQEVPPGLGVGHSRSKKPVRLVRPLDAKEGHEVHHVGAVGALRVEDPGGGAETTVPVDAWGQRQDAIL